MEPTDDEIAERNRAYAQKEAERLLRRMTECTHRWHQFSEFELSGIYCPKCCTLLDASLGDPWDTAQQHARWLEVEEQIAHSMQTGVKPIKG